MNLYQIANEYRAIAQKIVENDGEVTPELELELAITENNLQEKALNYAYVIKQAESESEMIDKEIERLVQWKQAREKLADALKKRIGNAMLDLGIEKVDSPLMKLSFRKSESVEITNPDAIPKMFINRKVTETPDKTAIKAALKEGLEVPGAELKENQNLQIK